MAIDLATMDKAALARVFDYSVLPKNTQKEGILQGCALTREYEFAAFYSSSAYWVPLVAQELADYPHIEVGTGIAFPFGSQPASVKAFETEDAVKKGATAVDIVMNIGALMDGEYDVVKEELELFVKAAGDAVTKCILEVAMLSDEDIAAGCKLIAEAGVQYAKTASGQFDGPSMEQFLVMKHTLEGTDIKLKVAGVKFPRPQNAYAFLLAGADRIGTRAAPQIINALDQLREIGLVPPLKEATPA
jgi:deoxyribose-phosphate aldolase